MFLVETWIDEARLNGLCDTLNLKNFYGVELLVEGVWLFFGDMILISKL